MSGMNEIGVRIGELREACGFTMNEMAEAVGVSLKTYIEYERSGEDIPIGVIFRIANKCGVDFNEIVTGHAAKLNTYQVVRAGEGMEIPRSKEYIYKDLAWLYGQKIMQPSMVTRHTSEAELNTHEGQEFDYVVSGSMTLLIDGREVKLSAGDSVYLNPMLPHGFSVADGESCTFLAVIAE